MKRLERSILLGLCAALLAAAAANGAQTTLASKLTRLQIVAHSDSDEDQALKLRVRDTVAAMAESLTADCADAAQAEAVLTAAVPAIRDAAQRTVYAAGRVTPVSAALERVYYPTRDYGTFRLPAGEYTALRVILGEGAGKNWWCVAWPALCSAAATEIEAAGREAGLTQEELRLMTENGGEARFGFWIVDRIGRVCKYLQNFR